MKTVEFFLFAFSQRRWVLRANALLMYINILMLSYISEEICLLLQHIIRREVKYSRYTVLHGAAAIVVLLLK